LNLSYNWEFRFDDQNETETRKIFQNKDYIGMACKAMSSRIRGVISGKTFEDFHENSDKIIKSATFKKGADGSLQPFRFVENNFYITDVNIDNPKPVDEIIEQCLNRSLAIKMEIGTKAKQAEAAHQQARLMQESAGQLEKQRINDDIQAEQSRKIKLEIEADSQAVMKVGQALADAKGKAEKARIEAQSNLTHAESQIKALQIKRDAEIELLTQKVNAEVEHKQALDSLEIKSEKEMAEIERSKFAETVSAIGRDTIVQMAKAGPETQAKLLKALGMKGFMVVDGQHSVNLFDAANGLIGNTQAAAMARQIERKE